MSYELLNTARYLLSRQPAPTPADACRAASTVYYALFHCLAKDCCDLFVGAQNKNPPQRAWQHLYRSLNHATISDRCRNIAKMQSKGFPLEIREYSELIKSMQWKRERLYYTFAMNPDVRNIANDIALSEDFMKKFLECDEAHRRAFAVYILFGEDRHEKKLIPV